MNRVCAILAVMSGTVAASGAARGDASYWDFNVFSRSTIGSASQGYGSSVQGATGAVGNAYFSGFSGRAAAGSSPSLPAGFYGGGDLALSGSINGGVNVAGNVMVNNALINGNVAAGGNLGGVGGSVNGDVVIGGDKTTGNNVMVNGSLATGRAYASPFNLTAASDYFRSTGAYAAGLASTTSYTNLWGELVIQASGPLTVVTINPNDFVSAWGLRVIGAGTVVVNVTGSSLSFGGKTWSYEGGASGVSTLLNMNEATTLEFSGGQNVNILAANAATVYSSGAVTGNLIVGSLSGAGSVNWGGGFSGAAVVPVPGTAMIVAGAGVLALRRKRR